MSDILHGTWLPATRSLFLWGETTDAPAGAARRGRRAKLATHPFGSSPERLRERLTADTAPADDHTLTLWLPSSDKTPFPSPEFLETGALPAPEGAPQLAAWQVTGLLVPADNALDLLLALSAGEVGADLRAWRVAALLAMEMLARQQVLPGLEREGFGLRAVWLSRPEPDLAVRLATLARSMPPLCRAAVDEPDKALVPRALLDDFVAAVINAAVRSLAFKPTMPATTPGGRWLAALLGDDPLVQLKGAAADELFKSWQAWAAQGQAAGDDVFRLTFRLEPPEHVDRPWTLAYLLRATDDPSLLVPAAQI